MADHVDLVLEQWARERPDLDTSSMAVVARLSRLAVLAGAEMRRTFERHGLDPAQFDVLATLRRAGDLTPAELTRASMVTSGAISQRLDRLEARGLLRRRPSPRDGRSTVVELTGPGRDLIDAALPDHVATMDRLLAGMGDDERDALARTLGNLLESLGDLGRGLAA